jgi:hypothetical protein
MTSQLSWQPPPVTKCGDSFMTQQEPIAWCDVNTNIFSLFPLLRFSRKPKEGWNPLYTKKQLDAAFALGAAQERESCAKVAAKFEPDEKTSYVTYPSTAIRARSKA